MRAAAFPLLLVALAAAARRTPAQCGLARLDGYKRAGQTFGEPLRLNWDSWHSSQLVTTIAGILLQQGLGFSVELVELPTVRGRENSATADLYEAVSTGALHAALEVWPEGKSAQISQFGSYNLGGSYKSNLSKITRYTDLRGRSGVFETCRRDSLSALGSCIDPLAGALPKMLTGAFSSQAGTAHFSQMARAPTVGFGSLRSDGRAAECSLGLGCADGDIWRPPACAAERNCSVQLKHITRAYDKEQIEKLIISLGLPIEVAYVGAENWARQVAHSYLTGQGGLFYSWYPQVPVAGIPMEKFERVNVPFDDDPSEDYLQKVHWDGLIEAGAGDANAFFKAFELSNRDIDALVARPDVANGDIDSADIDSAACAWIKSNEERWSKWLKFPTRASARFSFCAKFSSSWCSDHAVSALFLQLGLAFVFLMCGGLVYGKHAPNPDWVRAEVQRHVDGLCADRRPLSPTRKSSTHYHLEVMEQRKISVDSSVREISTGRKRKSVRAAGWEFVSLVGLYLSIVGHHIYLLSGQPIARLIKRQRATFHLKWDFDRARKGVPTFFSHVRTLENFVAGNVDPRLRLPPEGPADNWVAGHSRTDTWIFFFSTRTWFPVVIQCLGLALLSGAGGSLIYLLVRWDTYKLDAVAWAVDRPTDMPHSLTESFGQTRARLNDLTANFLFFPTFLSIGFLGFAVNRWLSFQATEYCIQGRTQDVGLLIGGAVVRPKSHSSRELAFRLYRYLNLTHMFAYGSLGKCPWFSEVSMQQLVALGLATEEEATLLEHTPSLFRMDTVVSWLSRDLQAGMRDGTLDRASKGVLFQHLSHLRMWSADLAAITSTAQPNLWTALMRILLDLLILLFVVGSPFRFFLYDAGALQTNLVLCSFALVFPWVCVGTLIEWMQDPYTNVVDGFNPDGLVCWSERVIFTNMRATFHSEEARPWWPTPNTSPDSGGRSAPAEEDYSGDAPYAVQRGWLRKTTAEEDYGGDG